jgi:hypothetical protein
MDSSFRDYIRLIIQEILSENPRTASQLVSASKKSDIKSKHKEDEDLEKEIEEFSSVAGGSIQGFTLPLGMSPDMPITGSKKRKKNPKRKNPSWA